MRKHVYLFFVLCFATFISSCDKENNEENNTPPKTKMEILTAKTWVYDEYFTNYNGANTQLAYKRGKANNALNLSLNRVHFKGDGTYHETTETGTTLNGTWKFLNSETGVETKNSLGTFTSNVILLSETSYIWYDQASGTYGKMIPQ